MFTSLLTRGAVPTQSISFRCHQCDRHDNVFGKIEVSHLEPKQVVAQIHISLDINIVKRPAILQQLLAMFAQKLACRHVGQPRQPVLQSELLALLGRHKIDSVRGSDLGQYIRLLCVGRLCDFSTNLKSQRDRVAYPFINARNPPESTLSRPICPLLRKICPPTSKS